MSEQIKIFGMPVIIDPARPEGSACLVPSVWPDGEPAKMLLVEDELHRYEPGERSTRPLNDEEKKSFAMIKNLGGEVK